jgi:NAD(P)H-hydrate epimerase
LRSPFRETIEAMNSAHSLCRIPIVSLDVPSGLDCDRGVACGLAVRATHTLSFGVAKPGFFVSEGPSHVGRLKVLAIGFPKKLVEREARTHTAFTLNMAKLSLPVRKPQTNKTHHGHAALFAGREGMWGAALLAANATYRVGAGYVTLASFADARDIVRDMPEILSGHLKDESFWRTPRWSVAAVGPGLGVGPETAEVIGRLKTMNLKRVVLDADAITVAAREKLYPFPPEWILTPHAGELSRLSGASAKDIERDRYRYAIEGARLCGCIVVLKGFRTIVSDGHVSSVVLSGNAALAKAGSGDVLTGLILGLLAQGLSSFRAAELAAFIHGSIADEWVREGKDPLSLQASDLAERLPWILARLRADEVSV